MSLNGRTDSNLDKPKMPKERTVRIAATSTANANTNYLDTANANAITLTSTTGILVGQEVYGNNIITNSILKGLCGFYFSIKTRCCYFC